MLWIRILMDRHGSALMFGQLKEGKNNPPKKQWRNFILSDGCFFWGLEASLLAWTSHWRPVDKCIAIFVKKNVLVKFYYFWSSNPLIRIWNWIRILIHIDLKYWIRIHIKTNAYSQRWIIPIFCDAYLQTLRWMFAAIVLSRLPPSPPPPRISCVTGCWEWTRDCCLVAMTFRRFDSRLNTQRKEDRERVGTELVQPSANRESSHR